MIVVREYVGVDGRSPFARWFSRLDAQVTAKVATALMRLQQGNLSGLKGVGAGIHERRIDFGPVYRIYLGRDGDELIVLLGAGTKGHQGQDVERARRHWQEYRRRKRREG